MKFIIYPPNYYVHLILLLLTYPKALLNSLLLNINDFLGYSIRSIAEVVTCLHKAKRRNYIDNAQFDKLYKDSFDLLNMTVAFKQKVK